MSVPPIDAAKFICERGSWKVTNLALQKILYIAHMIHMGRTEERLINTEFEAWDYGPVVPSLYRRVRDFGNKPIGDVFYLAFPIEEGTERQTLEQACVHLLSKTPSELVAITHWPHGAWANNYVPGMHGIAIPDSDIISEYRARTSAEAA